MAKMNEVVGTHNRVTVGGGGKRTVFLSEGKSHVNVLVAFYHKYLW